MSYDILRNYRKLICFSCATVNFFVVFFFFFFFFFCCLQQVIFWEDFCHCLCQENYGNVYSDTLLLHSDYFLLSFWKLEGIKVCSGEKDVEHLQWLSGTYLNFVCLKLQIWLRRCDTKGILIRVSEKTILCFFWCLLLFVASVLMILSVCCKVKVEPRLFANGQWKQKFIYK